MKEREMLGIYVDGIQIRGFATQAELDEHVKKNGINSARMSVFSYREPADDQLDARVEKEIMTYRKTPGRDSGEVTL